jgi:hypothetical protein
MGSITNKERGGPFERMPSLEVPSPTATTYLKIETTYAHYNANNIQICL